jgi:CubicO group peptidase (beta-lactamase class C family)
MQRPLWTPGTQRAYHPWTWGFLVGEVVRRITGKTLGTFFAEEVARPLELSAWIGLPEAAEPRLAQFEVESPAPGAPALIDEMLRRLNVHADAVPRFAAKLHEMMSDSNSLAVRSNAVGGAFADPWTVFDMRAARAAEFPSSNLATDARSLARMYAATVTTVDGYRLLHQETVENMCVVQTSGSTLYGLPLGLEEFADALTMHFSLGFVAIPLQGFRAFGHPGRGGSLGFADPDTGTGFGYVMNRMATGPDQRAINLLTALRSCLQ